MAIPAVLLAGLWGYTATGLVTDQLKVRDDTSLVSSVGAPAHHVISQLQTERRLTALWQAGHAESSRAALEKARTNTDMAIEGFRRSSQPAVHGKELQDRTKTLDTALNKLSKNRSAIDRRTLGMSTVFQYYTDAIADSAGVIEAATQSGDAQLARAGAATTSLVQVTEMLSREDALLSNALVAGKLSATARSQFAQYVAIQRHTRAAMLEAGDLPGDGATRYARLLADPQWKSLSTIEDALTGSRFAALRQQAEGWTVAAEAIGGDLTDLDGASFTRLADDGSGRAEILLLQAALGTLAVLAALTVTGALMRRASRTTSGRLTRLTRQIQDLGESRLPQILAQLDRGERVSPQGVPPAAEPGADHLARLGVAVSRLGAQFEAMLVRQARGKEGTEKIFANLTRRTQILVHRLISLLDDLERKHEDSDLLQDIFRVDHLATRVRRHSENLVILGGSTPGRRGIRPLSITDVVRGAVSETEQYRRVEVRSLVPGRQVFVAARAVTDVTHLLAELIENGTSFSPPDTQVVISARKVAKGLALHVEDRGLGISPEQCDDLNALLANPPQPDMDALGKDPRLGLFVVAKLAERHGLKVSLRESDYGGTLAVVLLPAALLEEHESVLPDRLKAVAVRAQRAAAPAPAALTAAAGADALGQPRTARQTAGASGVAAMPAVVERPAVVEDPGAAEGPGAGGPRVARWESHGFPDYGGAGLLPAPDEGQPAGGAGQAWSPLRAPTDLRASQAPRPYGELPARQAGPHTHADVHPDADVRPHADTAQHEPAGRHAEAPGAPQPPADPGSAPVAGRPTPPAEPRGPGPSAQPLHEPNSLPTRTRGASLAEQLREEAAAPHLGHKDVADDMVGFTPGRAAANMMAIQRATRQARDGQVARTADLDGPAESRQHGTDDEL